MQALLLATGESRKLAPLTADRPSAMLPVGHQPVMAHWVELLAVQGFKRQLVSLHVRPASIEAYFGSGQRWGVTLDYVIQRDALGSAGALKWAARLVTETCLVMPADIIADLEVEAAVRAHRQQGNVLTELVGLAPGGAAGASVPTGIYIVEPAAVKHIPAATGYDIGRDLLPALVAAGAPVGQLALTGYWNDLATLPQFQDAQRTFMSRLADDARPAEQPYFPRPASVRGRRVAPGIWVGRNNAIHPSVRLAEPVLIGKNCRLGRGVVLGPHVVLGENVIIDEDATVSDSVIFDNTYVGKLVKIEQRIVAQNLMVDVVTGESVQVADAFWLSETPHTFTASIARRYRDALLAGALGLALLPGALLWGLAVRLATGRGLTRVDLAGTQTRPGAAGGAAPKVTVWHFNRSHGNRWAAWLGRWQSRLEIERWPELWSVVRGDLALVGLKPLTEAEAAGTPDRFGPARGEVEPGVTGLWYVQVPRQGSADEIAIADAYYAATRSWREDLRILARTPAAWLRRARAAIAENELNEKGR